MEDAKMGKRILLGSLGGFFLMCAAVPFDAHMVARPLNVRADFAPHQLLVKFKSRTPGFVRVEIHRGAEATVIRRFKADPRLELVRIPAGENLDSALAYYSTRADVQYAQKNFIYHLLGTTPNDPQFDQQWALATVNAPAAWDKTTGSFRVVVAVLDTGVDYVHPDLALNIWTNAAEAGKNCSDGVDNDGDGYVDDCRGWNFWDNNNDPLDPVPPATTGGHGTQVAGVIGAMGNNGLGVAGSNWNVQIMPLRITDPNGVIYSSVAAEAIDYAIVHGASIINASWGGFGNDSALLEAIQRARNAGILFVTAAGNWSSDNDASPTYPCSFSSSVSNVICVTATDDNDNLDSGANYGATSVQLGAPGVNILTTGPTEPPFTAPYVGGNGTSLAAAHVTGGAALLKACKAGLDYTAIKDILLSHTRYDGYLYGLTTTNGVVDYQGAFTDSRVATCDSTAATSTPVANAWGPYNVNLRNQPVKFDATRSTDTGGQLLLYFWDFGDGSFAVGPTPTHSYATRGSYTATLYVRDDQGVIASQSATVNIRPGPNRGLPYRAGVPPPPWGNAVSSRQARALSDR
jgi:subtilisin family serine protease